MLSFVISHEPQGISKFVTLRILKYPLIFQQTSFDRHPYGLYVVDDVVRR